MRVVIIFAVVVLVLWFVFNLFTFSVDETQSAVVKQFGEIRQNVTEPGLHFKTPFVQTVVYLEDRLLHMDIQPAEIITVDKQRLTVDSFTMWRISDPQRFVERLNGIRSNAEQRLDDIVYSIVRDVLGTKNFEEVLEREFLADVKQRAQNAVEDFGIEIIDIKIKRADLPDANQTAVFNRMISEREQIAQGIRAEGEEEALDIRSSADADVQIILAEGRKRAEELRGEGDAQALEIYANAYNQDAGFFLFWRTLESYKLTLASNTTLVLSADSEYLKLLDTMTAQSLLESINR